jgi:membrane-associated protease RseP (regulator of RpoE activity)
MINLLPIGQLDGGHVAYALLGARQDRWSERWRRILPLLALVVSGLYEAEAWLRADERALDNDWSAGMPWLVWAGVLWVLTRLGGAAHPPTEPAPLSRGRRVVAVVTLALFVLLFMPAWIRQR